jgi:hypothetical protein
VNNVVVCVNLAGARDATTSEVADTTGHAARIALDKVTRLNGPSLGTAWTRRRRILTPMGRR